MWTPPLELDVGDSVLVQVNDGTPARREGKQEPWPKRQLRGVVTKVNHHTFWILSGGRHIQRRRRDLVDL